MGKNSYFKPKFHVFCENCGQIDVDDTEFVDIEEDIQGCDLMTFICKNCEKQGKSRVYGSR